MGVCTIGLKVWNKDGYGRREYVQKLCGGIHKVDHMLYQNPFKNKKVGRSISVDNHWNFQWDWVADAWPPRKICFFLRNWSKFLISFRLNLQPTASRQATTCLKSLHFTCVLGLVLIPHSKCPGNPRETHAKSQRVAPRATVAPHLRSEREFRDLPWS